MPPQLVAGGPRVLLRRLREIMAERQSAQARLDKLVTVIASNMVAEVCSIYLRRAGGELELFATEGLNREAVHRTRLKPGEGLVGLVAENAAPLNLSNAPEHPSFSYRPETGEDPYRAFLAVPIVRGERVFGVLTVQNRTARHYEEEEEEALATIAMVLAEVVAQGTLVELSELDETELSPTRPALLQGEGLSEGLAIGTVFLHEPRVKAERMIADDPAGELRRLEDALEALSVSVDAMLESPELELTGDTREVIEAYRLFANDQGWRQRLMDAVRSGLTAEAAVERVQDETRARIARTGDAYLRERMHDFEDLARRLVRHLSKADGEVESLPDQAVVVARVMGPAELLDYGRNRIAGLVVEEATQTSHIAIVARSMNVPLIGGIEGIADSARAGDAVIVDADSGEVRIRPPKEVINVYRGKQALLAQRVAQFAAIRDEPAVTLDGVRVSLNMNAGLLLDLPHLTDSGADGIGLFRTELQFLIGAKMPRLADQITLYRQVLDSAGGKPVVFRTLDLGGDKIPSYGRTILEENPAMGWRAIRIALDRPGLLRYQLRALITAANGRPLRVMLPMIAEVGEFESARALLRKELDRAERVGLKLPQDLQLGAMLEVPSLLFGLEQMLSCADFISVGSNDLLQFAFASDRTNPRVARRYDTVSPAVLNLLRHIAATAHAAKRMASLSVCGEIAGRPLEAMTLVGLGFASLSMHASTIGPVKMMIRALDTRLLRPIVLELCRSPVNTVRAALADFAEAHKIPVGRN
ncbi:MAG TPA: phosphoenolpyruvate--protein phosphotransferase [Micropepsaceae bacterium]|nr:phosphoenolpyruvate--protein phosphotransferase [Micropepsaceae bacterium]